MQRPRMVRRVRFERTMPVCRTGALPLGDPRILVLPEGIEPPISRLSSARCTTELQEHGHASGRRSPFSDVKRRRPNQRGRTRESGAHDGSRTRFVPADNRMPVPQGAVCRLAEGAWIRTRMRLAPLVGFQDRCLTVEATPPDWRRRRESNALVAGLQPAAFPLCYVVMERSVRIELTHGTFEACCSSIELRAHGDLRGANRTHV